MELDRLVADGRGHCQPRHRAGRSNLDGNYGVRINQLASRDERLRSGMSGQRARPGWSPDAFTRQDGASAIQSTRILAERVVRLRRRRSAAAVLLPRVRTKPESANRVQTFPALLVVEAAGSSSAREESLRPVFWTACCAAIFGTAEPVRMSDANAGSRSTRISAVSAPHSPVRGRCPAVCSSSRSRAGSVQSFWPRALPSADSCDEVLREFGYIGGTFPQRRERNPENI